MNPKKYQQRFKQMTRLASMATMVTLLSLGNPVLAEGAAGDAVADAMPAAEQPMVDAPDKMSVAEDAKDSAIESVAPADKLIRIRHADDEDDADADDGRDYDRSSGRFRVEVRSNRSSYREGEAIRLKVRGNDEFFLYLINVDPRTGRGVAILPNRLQPDRRIKYPGGNEWFTVPNENLEFFSDRPGRERIIMVASQRYLDVDRLLRKSRSKSIGDFYEMEAPLDAIDDAIGETYGDKAIRVRRSSGSGSSRSNRLPKGIVIKELNLRIR